MMAEGLPLVHNVKPEVGGSGNCVPRRLCLSTGTPEPFSGYINMPFLRPVGLVQKASVYFFQR